MEEKKYKSKISERSTKYTKDNYDRIEVRYDKAEHKVEAIDSHCREFGYVIGGNAKNKNLISRASFIKKAIETQMLIDRGEYKLVKVE